MLTEKKCNKMFGGSQKFFAHESDELKCSMNLAVYEPPQIEKESASLPVVYWLSGLECTEQNFATKSGAQRVAAELGIVVVAPDTSPRGLGLPGEDDSYDFGSGAGFYLDATEAPWNRNYRMYSYVREELPRLLASHYGKKLSGVQSIFGHSMGGHGALTLFLRNPGFYRSVSAFAPISNPSKCPWGQKAFTGYLGAGNVDAWKKYDATELVKSLSDQVKSTMPAILIDQGEGDNFYKQGQLLPENFASACADLGVPLKLRMQAGYDHSYYFIASFVEDHLRYHAEALLKG